MSRGDSRRRALIALRDRELAEAAAALARTREALARIDEAIAETERPREPEPGERSCGAALEMAHRASRRRQDRLARLAGQRAATLERVDSAMDAVAAALRARRVLD